MSSSNVEAQSMSSSEGLDLRVLGELEDRELKLIAWGLVDGGFGEDELLDLLDDIAEEIGDDRSAEEILESLETRKLITKVGHSSGKRWRTRMAETVRLLARLRQLFPPHMKNGSWQTAATLVSDYRFVARPRYFPKRDVTVDEFLNAVTGDDFGPVRKALKALSAIDGGPLLLAPFQVRAAQAILNRIRSVEATATLVCAGTGSGKTKAVYFPALAHLASIKGGKPWTKMVALYPRNELLKDQLFAALKELRLLKSAGGTALTIGTFFGKTPLSDSTPTEWDVKSGERVCPFLRCLTCSSDLYWFNDGGVGGLKCSRSTCSDSVCKDELLLSRRQVQRTPPDVLLTTVETLNRRLGDDWTKHVFGVGVEPGCRPQLLLLDEVHTYTGLSGAQVTHLLRRWRHAVGEPVHTVGLSATVADGATFFGELTSTPPGNVAVVEPMVSELLAEGKEYLIALRGNPTAGAALLSTTIQTVMLLRRCLDPSGSEVSGGAYGSKVFAFTDDLDVTNRFFHYLRSAEGQTDRGHPDPKKADGSFANLRGIQHPGFQERIDDGQAWELCREIGHQLSTNNPMKIDRTSSQDPGFRKNADIVVATASLEVGLDDDSVGVVVQHKASRDAASFVQRRGRAGRTREMRPWTAVVLSDYGRDREAFQSWDALFDPVVPPIRLPISNRYVLRIQATHVLLDWLAEKIATEAKGSIWADLTGPQMGKKTPGKPARRKKVQQALLDLLESRELQRELTSYIVRALQLPKREVEQLMWLPPRGVLTAVVPTLLRRLESDWAKAGSESCDLTGTQMRPPLPDFLPNATFSELLLPEVDIVPVPDPNDPISDPKRAESMGIEAALKEFSPGKVTHRFAVGWTGERLWVPVENGLSTTDIHNYFEVDPLETVTPMGEVTPIRIVRPWKALPVKPEMAVKSSSNGRPIWKSSFRAGQHLVKRETPDYAGLSHLIPDLEFFLHKSGNNLDAYRFSLGATGTVSKGTHALFETHFVDEDGPVALGYHLSVDGVVFQVSDPGGWDQVDKSDPLLSRSLRVEWFEHCVTSNPELLVFISTFKLDWVAELSLSAIIKESTESGKGLKHGVKSLKGQDLSEVLDNILRVVFQSVDPTKTTGSYVPDEEIDVTKMHQEIIDLAKDPRVVKVVHLATKELLNPTPEKFEDWLRDRYLATVAGAVTNAISLLHDDVDVDELVTDWGPWEDGTAALYISERRPGGVGLVEAIQEVYSSDPIRFWRLLARTVGESETELVDAMLSRFVKLAATDSEVIDKLKKLRSATTHGERLEYSIELDRCLENNDLLLTDGVKIAISTRFLRPGMSLEIDRLLADLIGKWDSLESMLGLEVEPRTFAYLMSGDSNLDQGLGFSPPDNADLRTWRFNVLLSLLWPRGSWLRAKPVELRKSFQEVLPPDRLLFEQRIGEATVVTLSSSGANEEVVTEALTEAGMVQIQSQTNNQELRDLILNSLVTPIEDGVLELFPRVVGLQTNQSGTTVEFEVPEMMG